jgi:hypothetical protein
MFTYVHVVDKRDEQMAEYLFSAEDFIRPPVTLSDYFEEEGVYDYRTFRKWVKKSPLKEIKDGAMPIHEIWEGFVIVVTLDKHGIYMQRATTEEIKLYDNRDYVSPRQKW